MKIKQFIFAIMAIASLQGLAGAQNATTVTNGEKGKFFILTGATGVRGGYLSPDAMFMGGTAGNSYMSNDGYMYDIERDTLKITTAVDVIKTWDIYAGNGRIYRNGQTIRIETRYPDTTNPEHKYASIYAASAGMDTIVTMSNEWTADPSGERPNGFYPNYPYLVDGKTGKILRRVEPHWGPSATASNIGFGARVNACNNDATVLVGHSKRPGGAQWAPVFWDLKADTSFFVGTEDYDYGSLSCVNNDGTLIGGTARGKGVLIHYDRENKTFTVEDLPVVPGNAAVLVTGISETGLVLYIQSTSANDINGRKAYIYNMNDGSSVKLEDYVRELYGLEMPIPSFTAFGLSDDGRKMTGWSFIGARDVPYLITLDDSHIFAKPRQLTAKQTYGEMTVQVSWAAPLLSQYTLKGYDVYCDGEKLNAERLNPVETSFAHTGVQSGVHNYAVKAVYEEGESDFCTSVRLLVIAGDGCLPVQEIGHHLTYNRGVEVYWGLPSAHIASVAVASAGVSAADLPVPVVSGGEAAGRMLPAADLSAKAKAEADAEQEPTVYDMISYADLGGTKYATVMQIGDRLYASQYDRNVIITLNPEDMSVINQVEISGVSSIGNMEYVNGNLYLGTGREEIVVVDMETMTVSNRIKTKTGVAVRHISYIPTLNGDKGGFAYGDWSSLYFCDRYGRELTAGVPEIDVADLLVSGTAYHDGKLYIYSQTGAPQMADLYTVDFASGRYVAKQNLGDIRRLAGVSASGFIAGGLSINELPDGTVALALMLQYNAKNSHLAWMEVKRSPDLVGFNLYRSKDGAAAVRVNPEGQYIERLAYQEDLTEAGTYVYTVEAVSKNGCTSMLPDVKTTVTIEPIGECVGPHALTAYESAKAVRLDWQYRQAPGLVGFNIYRDDELLVEHLVNLRYTEFNMAKGDYTYRVEAFYNNSCVASDSIRIKVTHEGIMMPPAHLSLTGTPVAGQPERYDVEARWDMPYYEQPLAIGYCGMEYNGTGLQDGAPLYALIAWDSARLEPYRNLYVVGIEYFIGQGILSVEGLVYMNDTLAYQSPKAPRVNENAWNTLMFDRYFSMDQPMEVLVGYKVTYSDKTKPVGVFDYGPGDAGYGDLFSGDGQQWTTLARSGINANWCINALVVDKRDLEEAAAAAAAGKPAVRPVVKRMSMNAALALTEPKAVRAAKSSSPSVKLQGFNIYREGEKLNETPLTSFSYTDAAVPTGNYEYVAEAVYSEGSVKGNGRVIDLGDVANLPETLAESVKVFPNPARLYFRVEGEYTALEITDLSGKTLRRYTGGRSEIDATGLKAGLYVLRFTLADGTQRLQKIVLE